LLSTWVLGTRPLELGHAAFSACRESSTVGSRDEQGKIPQWTCTFSNPGQGLSASKSISSLPSYFGVACWPQVEEQPLQASAACASSCRLALIERSRSLPLHNFAREMRRDYGYPAGKRPDLSTGNYCKKERHGERAGMSRIWERSRSGKGDWLKEGGPALATCMVSLAAGILVRVHFRRGCVRPFFNITARLTKLHLRLPS
jgi:hypothetical protein